jgi:hypothetical protein
VKDEPAGITTASSFSVVVEQKLSPGAIPARLRNELPRPISTEEDRSLRLREAAQLSLCLVLRCAAYIVGARADHCDKKTIVTFSNSVEIPGQVLPAGIYVFKRASSASILDTDREFAPKKQAKSIPI